MRLSSGDLNADGYEDVFIAASMSYPFRYGVNSVLLNNRGTRFLDSEFILGVEPRRDGRSAARYFDVNCSEEEFTGRTKPILTAVCEGRSGKVEVWGTLGTRASVIFDYDEDGDLDIITNDLEAPPMVLTSNLTEQTDVNFLKVKLVGTKSNRDGIGARVTVHTPSQTISKVHDGRSGYMAQSSHPLYFGLGKATSVEKIEISWPSGQEQVISDSVATNDVITLTEE
jgi:hypothetical protein